MTGDGVQPTQPAMPTGEPLNMTGWEPGRWLLERSEGSRSPCASAPATTVLQPRNISDLTRKHGAVDQQEEMAISPTEKSFAHHLGNPAQVFIYIYIYHILSHWVPLPKNV